MEEHAAVVRDATDLCGRLDGADLVVCRHHRDEHRRLGDRLLDVARIDPAERIDREIRDPVTLLLERPAGVEDGMVLDRGCDDMVPAPPEGCRHPLDRPVVGLRASGGEEDLLRLRPDRYSNPPPRLLNRLPRLTGEGVDRRGVPEPLREVGEHRLDDLWLHRRRRSMVHVDRSLRLHRRPITSRPSAADTRA